MAIGIPVAISVSACRLETISVPIHAPDLIVERTAAAATQTVVLDANGYNSRYVISNPVNCPLKRIALNDPSGYPLTSTSVALLQEYALSSTFLVIQTQTPF